jgi:hypothetical protein
MAKKIPRTDEGRTKYGTLADGTNAAHIVSFEVLNYVIASMPGRPYNDESTRQIIMAINSATNLRIKSRKGNFASTDENAVADNNLDRMIMGQHITNIAAHERARRQWRVLKQLQLPKALKEHFRSFYSSICSVHGVVVRSNANLGVVY